MIGHQELSMLMYVVGTIPFLIVLSWGLPFTVTALIIVGMIIILFAAIWPNYLISYNKLQPLINRIRPEQDVVWIRITKGGMLSFQIAKKGAYGQTKGIMHGQKADVIDKGDYPIRCINGNPGILVHDMMSHNINPKHAVAWKQLFKKNKVRTGRDAYYKAKEGVDNA